MSVLEGCDGGELESAPVDIAVSPEESMKAALCERCVCVLDVSGHLNDRLRRISVQHGSRRNSAVHTMLTCRCALFSAVYAFSVIYDCLFPGEDCFFLLKRQLTLACPEVSLLGRSK